MQHAPAAPHLLLPASASDQLRELSPRSKALQRVLIEETLDPKEVNITLPTVMAAAAASPRRRGSAPSPLSVSGRANAAEDRGEHHQRA